MKNIGAVSLKLLMTGRKASKFLFMSGFQDPPYSNFVLFRKVIYYCDLLWFLYLSLTIGEKTVVTTPETSLMSVGSGEGHEHNYQLSYLMTYSNASSVHHNNNRSFQ